MQANKKSVSPLLRKTPLGYAVSIAASLFIIFSLSLNLNKASILNSFDGNYLYLVFLAIIFAVFVNRALCITDKRTVGVSLFAAIALSLITLFGNTIDVYLDFSALHSSKGQIVKSIIALIGFAFLYYSVIVLLYNFLFGFDFRGNTHSGLLISAKIRTFFLVWIIIFLSWMIYLITYYPGILTPDSISQIKQAIGIDPLKNHHPVAHTFIISIFMAIGRSMGSLNYGVCMYSLFQIAFMSAVFSFSVYYMCRKGMHKVFIITALLYYSLFPVHGYYSVTMWKDQPFACFVLLYVICCIELVTKQRDFFNKKIKWAFLIFVLLGVLLFRNNGVYVFVLSIPFIIVFLKKCRRQLIAVTLLCIIVYSLYKGPLFSAFDIIEGSKREALSIPLQQVARVVKYHGDELSEEHLEVIKNILPVNDGENIGAQYNPRLSDPVKKHFNDEYYKHHKIEFYKTWAALFVKYPGEYIKSFVCNSYGYWYPETVRWVAKTTIKDNDLNIKQEDLMPKVKALFEKISLFNLRYLPVISMLYSVGFAFILLFLLLMLTILKRKYKSILVFVPLLILWLTVIASPVHAEFRYIYGLYTSMPILFSYVLHLKPVKRMPQKS